MPGFKLASGAPGGTIPRVVEKDLAAGADFLDGALMLVNGSGQYAECGADPASVAAVSLSGGGAAPAGSFGARAAIGKREFPPGRVQGVAVKNQLFRANYVGTLPGADGGSYGVVRDTDSYWKVDFAETVNTRVKLVGRRTNSPENVPEVLVKFLDANVQEV